RNRICATTIKLRPARGGTIGTMSEVGAERARQAQGAPADTFARFLGVLAETMDDHEASGESLAARVHLSRFHFDRLAAPTAGEPPAARRPRVLPARAADRPTP